jgi:hypothetical protein
MRWEDLSSMGRILLTLGTGFSVFVLALVCTSDARVERAATPLFLVAALLQPTGILVMMEEFSQGGEPAHGFLFMNVVMAIQHGCAFWSKDRTVLALTTIIFVMGAFTIALDLLGVDHNLIGVVMGSALLCVAWSLDRSRHRALAGLVYFFGAAIGLAAAYDWLRRSVIEVLFLGLSTGIIFLSTVARSRSLLFVGTAALVGYLVDFIAAHFADNLNAPLLLMLIGFILIGCGAAAVKVNSKYIRQQA